MFTEVAAALEVGAKIWEHRNAVANALGKATNRLRHGNLKVVVFGAGGVGKTTLGHFLEGKESTDLGSTYVETLVAEKRGLPGGLYGTAIITPGQPRRLVMSSGELDGALSSEDLVLVVNVVAYGYHSFADMEHYEHRLYVNGGMQGVDDFMKEYLEDRRAEEIKQLQYVLDMLRHKAGATRTLRLVTLVAKQDLWWSDRNRVREHYQSASSGYARAVAELERHRGVGYFQHELLSVSFMINSLRSTGRVVLAANATGYDEPLRYANICRLGERLVELCVA